jgi:hypothetical protein
LHGNDNVWVVNSKLVKGDWTNVSASTIATTIINSFAPNFSSAKVQTGLPAITINFFLDANVGQALDRICRAAPERALVSRYGRRDPPVQRNRVGHRGAGCLD